MRATRSSIRCSVRRVVESPRVTKPYGEQQWQAIDAFGQRIEQQLAADDVRITIGGEPTFVAIDDPDAPNGTPRRQGRRSASCRKSDHRLRRASRRRAAALRTRQVVSGRTTAALGVLVVLAARRGVDVVGPERRRRRSHRLRGDQPSMRAELLEGIARRLELPGTRRDAAYEDPWHFAAQERTFTREPRRRATIASTIRWRASGSHACSRRTRPPVGFVLPAQRWNCQDESRRWMTEPGRRVPASFFVLPGDSPMGFRLPLAIALRTCAPLDIHTIIAGQIRSRAQSRSREPRSAPSAVPARRRGRRAHDREEQPAVAPVLRLATAREPRWLSSRATAELPCSCRRWRISRTISIWSRPWRTRRAELDDADSSRRLRAAERSAIERDQSDAGPRRHRGQHPSGSRLGRDGQIARRASTRTLV